MADVKLDPRNDVSLQVKILAIEQVIEKITGEKPIVEYKADYALVRFTNNQKVLIHDYIENRLKGQARDSNLRFDMVPLVLPPVIKVYGKFLVGALVVAFLLGKKFSR